MRSQRERLDRLVRSTVANVLKKRNQETLSYWTDVSGPQLVNVHPEIAAGFPTALALPGGTFLVTGWQIGVFLAKAGTNEPDGATIGIGGVLPPDELFKQTAEYMVDSSLEVMRDPEGARQRREALRASVAPKPMAKPVPQPGGRSESGLIVA